MLRIERKPKDLGGFSVARLLPHHSRRMVGPSIFFDHPGPAHFAPGTGIDVPPHPHIGLATVTHLFDCALGHKDTPGTVLDIGPPGADPGRGRAYCPAPSEAGLCAMATACARTRGAAFRLGPKAPNMPRRYKRQERRPYHRR